MSEHDQNSGNKGCGALFDAKEAEHSSTSELELPSIKLSW
jgi:hypothetical protein